MSVKILLLADGKVGEEIGEWLLREYPRDLMAVVTTTVNSISCHAKRKNIPTYVFESEEVLLSQLSVLPRADLGLLAWWPKLVTKNLLRITKLGFINTHPSLLPHNRGKHYNFWAIVEQRPFGVTLHFVDEGIDSGDIICQVPIPCSWEDNGQTLYVKAQNSMITLFQEAYPQIRAGTFTRRPQDLTAGSIHFAKELEPASFIDLQRPYMARDLLNLLRARTFNGRPACRFEDNAEMYEVTIQIRKLPHDAV
jgi:methionyl-tRNA formyltransferase